MPRNNYVQERIIPTVRALEPGTEFHASRIMVHLAAEGHAPGLSSVSSVLRDMAASGEVERVNRTTYRKLAPAPVVEAAAPVPPVPVEAEIGPVPDPAPVDRLKRLEAKVDRLLKGQEVLREGILALLIRGVK